MTEPDEALLWAREQAKQLREAPNDPTRDLSAEIDVGMHDDELSDMAHGYRTGAAASAERIKELEAALDQIYDLLSDAMQADCENGVRSLNEAAAANYLKDFPHTRKALTDIQAVCRSMLKEPDQ